MHPETRFKNRIRPLLEALPRTYVIKIQQQAIRGHPDFVLCIGGLFIALELKKSRKDKPEPLQAHTLRHIERAGGTSYVVSPETWPEVYKQLQAFALAG